MICVHLCCFSVFLFFSHSQAIKMKRWNNFVAKLALDKRVDFEEGDIGLPGGAPSRRMQMPWASYAYFTSNGAQWFHQSNHCSPFCPYFVTLGKAAGCGLQRHLVCHGRHPKRHVRHQSLGASFSTRDSRHCAWCALKIRKCLHHVFITFSVISRYILKSVDTVKWHQYVLEFGFTSTLHCKDQIIRFGGDTDPSLPWPENHNANDQSSSMEKLLGEVLADHRSWEVFTSGLDWIWLNDHEMMIWFDCNLFFIGNLSDLFKQWPYGMCLTLFKKSLAARHHSVSDTAGKDGAKDVPWLDFQTLRWSTANIVTANS